jgi:hypothetical protein
VIENATASPQSRKHQISSEHQIERRAVKPAPRLAAQAVSAGFNVHSSVASAFLAPMLRSNLSVVDRSAEMPFSSCPVDRKPLADRGSDSIARSFFF